MTNALKPIPPKTSSEVLLTPKQSSFVDLLLANGGSRTQAAIDAGYSPRSAHVEASRLIKNERVLQELYRRSVQTLGVNAVKALHTVSNLVSDAKSEYVRLEASKDIMDRAGLRSPDSQVTNVGSDITVKIDLTND